MTAIDGAVAAALQLESVRRRRRLVKALGWTSLALAVLWFTANEIGLNPIALAKGRVHMWDFLTRMFPPDLSYIQFLGRATVETVQIAVWGTLLAVVFSIPLSLLAARNTTPLIRIPWFNEHWERLGLHLLVFHTTRMFLNCLRGINELIFALIFVSAVGLGPFAGVLAIALHATGMLAKFCGEEIEGVDRGQVEAMQATGASKMQVILFAVIPQAIPAFISYSIFRFDVSIRSATVLGLVGAGGLGFSLIKTLKLFRYPETATCILVIFLLVWATDWVCSKWRAKII
ncbi:MAG: phosphonate ABC transporter, permease protein PhnE [Proteobacteria bacterium]|nr:phosphonate ABC transporter, permease protein PhnE [Pseudomonadota bacterium]MCH8090807.1 phosphonate ABC transporter, permease protein PhnE [Pseudomonadota bacterium]MCH8096869.1 phosphonate ABC transporter, permease protein PhnE [Pseudomonadota bacterium]